MGKKDTTCHSYAKRTQISTTYELLRDLDTLLTDLISHVILRIPQARAPGRGKKAKTRASPPGDFFVFLRAFKALPGMPGRAFSFPWAHSLPMMAPTQQVCYQGQ